MSTQTWQKNTKIKIKCVGGGGGGLLYLLCLISSTLSQLEQSSLHPSTVLHHRLLLQTTCYNHLRLLQHLPMSSKGKRRSNRLGTPLVGGLRSQKGLQPFNPLQSSEHMAYFTAGSFTAMTQYSFNSFSH